MTLPANSVSRVRDRHRKRSLAQGLTEFALILPVLILAMLIVLDFGRLFMSYVTLTNATRVAANFGAVAPGNFTGTPDTTAYNATLTRETNGLACDLQPVGGHNPPLPTFPNGTGLNGKSVATMTCNFTFLTPLISGIFGGSGFIPITASAEFPVRTGAIENIGGSTTLPPPGSPIADFSFTGVGGGTINGSGNVNGTAPVSVNVVDNSSNAETWDWDWGDGSHDFVPNPPAHNYNIGGFTYTVTLTVQNTSGSSSRQRTVQVSTVAAPPPVAGFYGTPVGSPPDAQGGGSTLVAIRGSRPLVVNFTNTSTGAGTAFSWDFGDGSSPSTQTSPQHQYSNLGIYTVTLSITAPPGGNSSTQNGYVTVGCVVPNFANTSTANAKSAWNSADFTGTIRYRLSGSNGNGKVNPPSPPGNIVSQSLPGGNLLDPVKQGGSYVCNQNILLDYQ